MQLPWAQAVTNHHFRHQYQTTRCPARLFKRKPKLWSPINVWSCVNSIRNASLSIFPRNTRSANWILERRKNFRGVIVQEMNTVIFKWAEALLRWLVEVNCEEKLWKNFYELFLSLLLHFVNLFQYIYYFFWHFNLFTLC